MQSMFSNFSVIATAGVILHSFELGFFSLVSTDGGCIAGFRYGPKGEDCSSSFHPFIGTEYYANAHEYVTRNAKEYFAE